MSTRRDPEATIVQFFLDADEATVRTVFRIVRGLVDQRGLLRSKPSQAKRPRRPSKTNGGVAVQHAQE